MTWIQTYSGEKFDFLNPKPDMVHIQDIAHALANICRFTGHCEQFYSVAQHSVIVASIVPTEYRLEALMHDAVEAYTGDINRQIASFVNGESFGRLEQKIEVAIAQKFNFLNDTIDHNIIKKADNIALATECRDLMLGERGGNWELSESPHFVKIVPLYPSQAEDQFLNTFHSLY